MALNPWNLLDDSKGDIEAWQELVHVCRRWRSLVFQSPRRLNLRLFCTSQTPATDTLDVWPALPLLVSGDMSSSSLAGTDNVIAALGQSNRVCQVDLESLADWQLEKVMAAMQVSFPELTEMQLGSDDETLPVIPDSFLDGSAPRLESFSLDGIPFPGLPKLLRSATQLVSLSLTNIPHSGYISPEAMVTLLSVLPSLRTLSLGFEYPQSRPDWEIRSLPPPKRSILPALNEFYFIGVTEYLEELVTGINTPQLGGMYMTFFNEIDHGCPQLAQFINCTPKLRALDKARVRFDESSARVNLRYGSSQSTLDGLEIAILCGEPDWQFSSIEQVCNSPLHPLSTVEDLYIERQYSKLIWKNDAIENTLWLQFLLPFTAVKNLYLSKEFAPDIAPALEELVVGGITEVLPRLQNIFVEWFEPSGPFQKNIEQFVAARRLSNRPIAISDWRKSDWSKYR